MQTILIRLLVTLAIISTAYLAYRLIRRLLIRKTSKLASKFINPLANKATILYFTTPDCVACKTAQKPALQQLQENLGQDLKVVEVNAYEEPELASKWGVMSVPATFVLDREGVTREINFGVTPYYRLLEQIERF